MPKPGGQLRFNDGKPGDDGYHDRDTRYPIAPSLRDTEEILEHQPLLVEPQQVLEVMRLTEAVREFQKT